MLSNGNYSKATFFIKNKPYNFSKYARILNLRIQSSLKRRAFWPSERETRWHLHKEISYHGWLPPDPFSRALEKGFSASQLSRNELSMEISQTAGKGRERCRDRLHTGAEKQLSKIMPIFCRDNSRGIEGRTRGLLLHKLYYSTWGWLSGKITSLNRPNPRLCQGRCLPTFRTRYQSSRPSHHPESQFHRQCQSLKSRWRTVVRRTCLQPSSRFLEKKRTQARRERVVKQNDRQTKSSMCVSVCVRGEKRSRTLSKIAHVTEGRLSIMQKYLPNIPVIREREDK